MLSDIHCTLNYIPKHQFAIFFFEELAKTNQKKKKINLYPRLSWDNWIRRLPEIAQNSYNSLHYKLIQF